jgi:formylglycine-generating enzyme
MTGRFLFLILLFLSARDRLSAQQVFTNSIGMEFLRVEAGTMTVGEFSPPYPVPSDTVSAIERPFVMWMGEGRPYNANEFALAKEMAERDRLSGFKVTLHTAYCLGKFEVTQGQWKAVMGRNPSTFRNGPDADRLPVESVSWRDAKKFIKKLNRLERTSRYRLPSEFEWEYAARASAVKDITWDQIQLMANLSKKKTDIVGSKLPNAWGFYDMLGNVWEWTNDKYNGRIFADVVPPSRGKEHVLKGASFAGDVKNATYMTHAAGPGNGWDVGFRVLMEVKNNKP